MTFTRFKNKKRPNHMRGILLLLLLFLVLYLWADTEKILAVFFE